MFSFFAVNSAEQYSDKVQLVLYTTVETEGPRVQIDGTISINEITFSAEKEDNCKYGRNSDKYLWMDIFYVYF